MVADEKAAFAAFTAVSVNTDAMLYDVYVHQFLSAKKSISDRVHRGMFPRSREVLARYSWSKLKPGQIGEFFLELSSILDPNSDDYVAMRDWKFRLRDLRLKIVQTSRRLCVVKALLKMRTTI